MGRPFSEPGFRNFATLIYLVDGLNAADWSKDAGVETEYPTADILTSDVGADGIVHLNQTNDPRVRHKIKFAQQSHFAQYLWGKAKEQVLQADRDGTLKTVNVRMIDPASGESFAAEGYFVSLPPRSQMQNQGDREYTIEFANGKDAELPGTLTTPPVRS